MAFTTTANGSAVLSPEQISQLIVLPLQAESVALRASTVVQTGSHSLRVPRVVTDAAASWTPEDRKSRPIRPRSTRSSSPRSSFQALSLLSNELVADSSPSALKLVGDSVVRDVAKKIDQA